MKNSEKYAGVVAGKFPSGIHEAVGRAFFLPVGFELFLK
jgi:hypothetical protein